MPHRQGGFTLLEMSIVIAVIGLLIGGILAGRYMIAQSELQNVLNDFTQFKTAYQQFREKYGAVPGDMSDATDYWGAEAAGDGKTCNAASALTTPKVPTCNSLSPTGYTAADYATYGMLNQQIDRGTWEMPRAWQQLADAGLIQGSFTGTPPTAAAPAQMVPVAVGTAGTNAPSGKRTGTGYTLYWLGPVAAGGTTEYVGDYKTVVLYGAPTAADITSGPALTPREAQTLDLKSDDGNPGTGIIYTWASAGCVNDTDTTHATTALYALLTKSTQCNLGFHIE